MFDDLVKQFAGSGVASEAISALTQGTELNETQARDAVQATAEGAAQAATSGEGTDLAGIAGSLLGGSGGPGGALAGMLGGGGGATGVPSQLVDTVAAFVAQKTGLSPEMSKAAVNVVLPKVMAYFKGDKGDGGGNNDGGLLGGLLG